MTCRKGKCTEYHAAFIHEEYVTMAEHNKVQRKEKCDRRLR